MIVTTSDRCCASKASALQTSRGTAVAETSERFAWRWLLPQRWPLWLALWLMRRLATRDYPSLLAFGIRLGDFARWLPLPQRRVVRRNLSLCFPKMTESARQSMLQQHFRESGITLPETALAWFSPPKKLLQLVRFEGIDIFDRLTASGRGVILLAAHFTTLEIGARFITAAREVHAVYKPSKDPLLSWFFRKYRGAVAASMIASDDIRAMVRVLKAGGAVWYAPDQAFRAKGAEMVPFFGIPVATNTATSRLARLTGAAVLPYFVERLPGTAGYVVRIGEPLEDFPGVDSVTDTLRHHALIENEVRRLPAQYLWLHKRFKGLGSDYPDYYSRRYVEGGLRGTGHEQKH
ncbi:MAG: lipid A biosynthesis lauroyl acyltransferase [Gammaproteobacteria bacterium]|nr:lipid A biosynthesis lauroyl acyltransferase [Gammaproteobacteria bacterium]MBM4230787.1 lipid A biosynthesis lauroyl acyltransferase [Gammaproteobacteria bacterium]